MILILLFQFDNLSLFLVQLLWLKLLIKCSIAEGKWANFSHSGCEGENIQFLTIKYDISRGYKDFLLCEKVT